MVRCITPFFCVDCASIDALRTRYNGNTELDDVWELTLFNADEGFEFNSQGTVGEAQRVRGTGH